MTSNLPEIEMLRNIIDEKDEQLHQLLCERTGYVAKIGDVKKNSNDKTIFRPAREAEILRKILGKDSGHLPKSVLISIWREMISSFSALQGDFSIAYWGDLEADNIRDLVRYYFGHTVQVRRCSTVTAVLSQVSEEKATVGIVPMPETTIGNEGNWWLNLAMGMNVSGVLPFVLDDPALTVKNQYYMISKSQSDDTKDDIFMLKVNTVQEVSRMSIVIYLKNIGYEAKSVAIHDNLEEGMRQHLLEVEGYIASDMVNEFKNKFIEISDNRVLSVQMVGQFPAPYYLNPKKKDTSIKEAMVANSTITAPF